MTSKSTITRERLQEIAEDGFLKHGESKEMARMLLAAQAHITELEAAPPAPIDPGEEPVPVMPAFPGKVMTQRECWQAGKEVGLVEGRICAAIPDGYVVVPKEPTEDMCFAPDVPVGNKTWDGYQSSADMAECKAIYVAMLAAAPQEVK